MHVHVKLLNKSIVVDYSDCLNINDLKNKVAKMTKTSTKCKTRIILNGVEQTDNVNLLTLGLSKVNCVFYIITKELKKTYVNNNKIGTHSFFYKGIAVKEIEV